MKFIRVFVFAGLAAIWTGAAPLSGQEREEMVDCIAAVVNGEAITLADVRIAETFGLVDALREGMTADPRRAVLEALVDRKVVAGLGRERTAFDPARVQDEIDLLSGRLGADGLKARLAEYGLTLDDLRAYFQEKNRVESIVADRFSRSVTIALKEIETVYADVYVPAETKAGRTPRPLVEMIEPLEAELRAAKIKDQSVAWVRSLRDQADVEIRPDCLKK